MLMVLDTETTGLVPGQIVQLSYIMLEGNFAQARNYFFAVDYMPRTAQDVHGFSVEELRRLSGGACFADRAQEIESDIRSADVLAGHNLDFDSAFLKAELGRCGLRYRMRRGICTMKYFTKQINLPGRDGRPKPPRLTELSGYFDLSHADIAAQAGEWFLGGENAHDARYDVAATALCITRAIERGLLRNLLQERNMAHD